MASRFAGAIVTGSDVDPIGDLPLRPSGATIDQSTFVGNKALGVRGGAIMVFSTGTYLRREYRICAYGGSRLM